MNRLTLSVAIGILLAAAAWIVMLVVVLFDKIVPIWPFAILAVFFTALIFAVDYATEKGEKK